MHPQSYYGYGYPAYGGYGGGMPQPPGYGMLSSAYPQSGAYGGGAGGGGGNTPRAQDPMSVATNPAAFEQMYTSQLSHLTFNSKPIITNLTLIAHEHVQRMASVVARVLDQHILMAIPPHRLPSMYLLDSICKNIGAPYTDLWAPRIPTLFLESYRVVDQPTKRRMEDLLATWRSAGPGGHPLFGDGAQWAIERALFGSAGAPQPQRSRPQALANIERLMALTQATARTGDPAMQDRLDMLYQLRDTVQNSEVSQEDLAQVHAQLDALSAAPAPAPAPPAAEPAPAAAEVATPLPPALAALSGGATPGGGTPAGGSSTSDLIANLMKAGLIQPSSSTATPPPAAAPAPAAPLQDQAYTDFVMSIDLRLTSYDLARAPPELEVLLRDSLPLPCRQCCNRYPGGEAGKGALDQHLDWHFTQNRRSRASAIRGQCRTWLEPVARWVRGGFDDTADPMHEREAGAAGDVAREQELRSKFSKSIVVVPTDAEVSARACPICKEKFQSVWSEEEEEWIWQNATEVDGTYYHASCYYSVKSMSETVSRSTGTPPVDGAANGTLKRKAEEEAAGARPAEEPPVKKLAGEHAEASEAPKPEVKSEQEDGPQA